jgi:hypothetical protein
MPQTSPNLPIAFSGEQGFGEELANLGNEFLVGRKFLGTSLVEFPRMLLTIARRIEAGARQAPDGAHSRHTIRLLGGR